MVTAQRSRPRLLSTELLLGVLGIVLLSLAVVGGVLFMQAEASVERSLQQEARTAALAVQQALHADPGGTMASVVARGLLDASPAIAGIHATVGGRMVFGEPPTMDTDVSNDGELIAVTLDDDGAARVTIAMQLAAAAPIRQRWTITLLIVMAAVLGLSAVLVAALLQWRVAGPLQSLRDQAADPRLYTQELPAELQLLADQLRAQHEQRASETHRLGRTEDELQRASGLQRLMLREMDHRVRNNLASLSALIELERYACDDVHAFADRLGGRLRSMQSVQSLLSKSSERATDLAALATAIVPDDLKQRVSINGPHLEVGGSQAVPLGMLFHELLTNAIRHGALSKAEGSVAVAWGTPRFPAGARAQVSIDWTETGGPQPDGEPSPGTGTGILKGLAESELHGGIDLRYPPTGATHRVRLEFRRREHAGEV